MSVADVEQAMAGDWRDRHQLQCQTQLSHIKPYDYREATTFITFKDSSHTQELPKQMSAPTKGDTAVSPDGFEQIEDQIHENFGTWRQQYRRWMSSST